MNSDKVSESNKRFFSFFHDRLEFIENSCMERIEGWILMCCYIDSIGGYRFPNLRVGLRFKNIILEYSSKKDFWKKISLPLLKRNLLESDRVKHDYYESLFRKLGMIESNYIQRGYNTDVTIFELEDKAKNVVCTPFSDELRKKFEEFEFINILYNQYRNCAVHATFIDAKRAPDLWKDEDEPHYEHVHPDFNKIGKTEGEVWFSFPEKFILKTLQECLDGLKAYVHENCINLEDLIMHRAKKKS
jgi:hypothetical protein